MLEPFRARTFSRGLSEKLKDMPPVHFKLLIAYGSWLHKLREQLFATFALSPWQLWSMSTA